jgi:hypothetical protein
MSALPTKNRTSHGAAFISAMCRYRCKVFLGWRTKFPRTADAFRIRRCEGPHCFPRNQPRTLASAMHSVAAVELSRSLLSRDFWRRSIFDFCNNIGTKRTCRHVSLKSVMGFISGLGLRSARAYCLASLQNGQQRSTGWTAARRGFSQDLRRTRRTKGWGCSKLWSDFLPDRWSWFTNKKLELNTKSHLILRSQKVFPLYSLAAVEVSGWPSGGSNPSAPARQSLNQRGWANIG